VDEQDRLQWLEVLRSTPSRLKALLEGVPRAVALWPPAPGKWSILEIVCHMRDMEREAYLARYERILAEDEPRLPDVDGDVYSLEMDYRAQAHAPVLRDWTRLRGESLRLLSRVKGLSGTAPECTRRRAASRWPTSCAATPSETTGRTWGRSRRSSDGTPCSRGWRPPLPGWPRPFGPCPPKRCADRPNRESGRPIEIACHLRDADRVYAERVSKMAFSDRPTMWLTDNARLAEKLRYLDSDPRAVLKEHRRRREDLVSLLRALPHGAWQRTGVHPRRGELTIEAMAGIVADHDDGHLSRIEAVGRS
jgi:DinB family protein